MADRIKQNQKLRQAIEDARLRAAKLAKDTEHPDPMDVTYLGLALEVVELRLTCWESSRSGQGSQAGRQGWGRTGFHRNHTHALNPPPAARPAPPAFEKQLNHESTRINTNEQQPKSSTEVGPR